MAVYFIAEEGTERVKIGFSCDVYCRMRSLRASNSLPLILLRAIDGTRDEEEAAHRHFDYLHITGEWFQYSDEMFDYGQTIDVGPRRDHEAYRRRPLERSRCL